MATTFNYDQIKEEFIKTCKVEKGEDFVVDGKLANDVINYILRQLNNASLQAVLNVEQHGSMLKDAVQGLFLLCYVSHYTEDLLDRDVVFKSGCNMLKLMFSRVLYGREYNARIEEIRASQPISVQK